MNAYRHEDDVALYIHMMEYPKALIPLVTAIISDHFYGYQAPMEYIMTVTDWYAKMFRTNYASIHADVREYVGCYLLNAVGRLIEAHRWGTRHTPKITGMLLEYIFRDGTAKLDQKFENVAANLYWFVEEAFYELH